MVVVVVEVVTASAAFSIERLLVESGRRTTDSVLYVREYGASARVPRRLMLESLQQTARYLGAQADGKTTFPSHRSTPVRRRLEERQELVSQAATVRV